MQLNPYLFFKGRCEEAFRFYEKALDGKIVAMLTYGDSPDPSQSPPEHHKLIMHARMTVGDKVLMGSDAPEDRFHTPQGFSVSLGIEDPLDAERVFAGLSEGDANVIMPIAETFWAERFGMLVDQFGTPWMINCEKKR
jgi:PhnB protein